MPSPNEVLIRFRADTSQLVSETGKVLEQFRIINDVLGRSGGDPAALRGLEQLGTVVREDTARAQELQKQLERVNQLRIRGEGLVSQRPSVRGAEKAELGLPSTRPSIAQLTQRQAEIEAELNAIYERRNAILAKTESIARTNEEVARRMVAHATQRQFIDEKIAAIQSGQFEADLVSSRIQTLNDTIARLQAAREEVRAQAAEQTGQQRGGRIEEAVARADKRLEQALDARKRAIRELQSVESRLRDDSIKGTQREIQLQQQLREAIERRGAADREVARARRAQESAGRQQQASLNVTGAAELDAEIGAQIAQVQELLFQTLQSKGAEAFAPELKQLEQQLLRLNAIEKKTTEEEREQLRLLQEFENIKKRIADGGDLPQVTESLADRQLASLSGFERTLFTAFDDVGRRFRTALQFAISGAAIYGAQRLAREFLQAAIEVERAFADIESAIEFDLADEGIARGSVEFDARVEGLRRNVLQLANEFNQLPTEANEAAFKMVARFSETEDALKAVRAQFLATRISTISQDEAIRALSATAEGFAQAVLESNDSMTLNERLLQREKVAAENYAAALDEAVLIQQRFGVEVEDTLEGTARAAETFRQLGFSRQQTEATVAAVSRQLGQTGSSIADSLIRAFGQITQPETRDALLELAAASDNLNLSLEDFSDGAALVDKLDRQFAQLEQRDPQVANQLRNIIGQRRETDVVAAFFGTADLRQAIEVSLDGAAGAAERRFSFLAQTISERIQSIIAQFQSLAQNFERLELFGPIKIALAGLDTTLSVINQILQALQSVVLFLDNIGESINVRIGTGLKNVLVTAISLASILRTAAAAINVITVTRAGALRLQSAAAGVGGASAPSNAALAGIVASSAKMQEAFRKAGVAVSTGASRLASSLGTSRLALAGWVGGIIAAGAMILSFVESGRQAIETLKEIQFFPARAELAAQERERQDPFGSPEEREAFKLEQELRQLQERAEGATRGFFETWAARIFPIADEATRKAFIDQGNFGDLLAIGATGLGFVASEESVVGSEAWWAARIEASNRAWRQAQLDMVAASIPTLQGNVATADERKAVLGLQRRLSAAQEQLNEASTPEEFDAAALAVQETLSEFLNVEDEVGITLDGITESSNAIKQRAAQLQRDLQLGRVPFAKAPEEFERLAEDARQHAADLQALPDANTPEFIAEIDANLADADQYTLDAIAARRSMFERERSRLQNIKDPKTRMEALLRSLNSELTDIRERGLGGTEYELDLLDEIAATRAETAEDVNNVAVEIARRKLGLARTLEDWQAAVNNLIEALRDSIPQITIDPADRKFFGGRGSFDDPVEAAKVADEVQGYINDSIDKWNNEAVIVAEANARLAGPINNQITQITARIKGLKVRIAQGTFFSRGEALQAQVELAELIASRVEAEAEAAAAWIRLQAGTGDSIRSLQAEITIVAAQLKITAQLYGEQSAQYLQLKLNQEELRNQFIQASLELEDLNRRLDSDLTNPFDQAQLDLVAIMRQLSQLDLGPLERARLEMERKQAEIAAERAFFDDRLFQLRFDFETGEIGTDAYVSALQRLLEGVDTSTRAGKELFLEITNLIESLGEDVTDFQFNIPSSIRLPTLFEVRRALAADQLGVNYMDNRVQHVTLEIGNTVELEEAFAALDNFLGSSSNLQAQRQAVGGAAITPGGF